MVLLASSRWLEGGAMRRAIVGCIGVLILANLAIGTSAGATALSAKSAKHTHTVLCSTAVKSHGKLTRSEMTACRASSLSIGHPCPSGSSVISVTISKTLFALKTGQRPLSLGKDPGKNALARACGATHAITTITPPAPVVTQPPATTTTTNAPPPITTTIEAPPPVTTTTRPPPPVTTTTSPPLPPPTTAAPVSCTPLTDGGNCYEPGEFCRNDDHGVTGRAGDGETITCEDNNGWRWEPT